MIESNLIKIAEQKVRKNGERGVTISIPRVFVRDNNLQAKESLEIYRSVINGKDCLLITRKL